MFKFILGMLSHLFWSLIIQPAQGAWFWISTFFTGNNRPPTSGSSDDSGDARAARRFPSDNERLDHRIIRTSCGFYSVILDQYLVLVDRSGDARLVPALVPFVSRETLIASRTTIPTTRITHGTGILHSKCKITTR